MSGCNLATAAYVLAANIALFLVIGVVITGTLTLMVDYWLNHGWGWLLLVVSASVAVVGVRHAYL